MKFFGNFDQNQNFAKSWLKSKFFEIFKNFDQNRSFFENLTNIHGWPSTQPNRITHNLAAHHRAAHSPAARWCASSLVCVTHMGNPRQNLTSQTAMKVALTLTQRRDDSTDVGPNYNAVWEYCTQPNLHTAEPLGCVQLGCVLLGCVQFG